MSKNKENKIRVHHNSKHVMDDDDDDDEVYHNPKDVPPSPATQLEADEEAHHDASI